MSTRLRTVVALMTSVTMAAGTIAGPAIGVLASVLRDEFDLTRAEVGRLAALYALVGALTSPLAGRLTDRIGGRWMMTSTAAAGSATFVAFALAPSYEWLMVMAVVSGLPNGSSNPGTNRLIAGLLAPSERGLVTGVKQSGVQLGRFLAGIVLPPAVVALGLRQSLLLVAVAAAAVALTVPLVVPADPVPERPVGAATDRSPLPPAVWWLAGYAFLLGAGTGATFAFTALYAEERLAFTNQQAGLLVGLSGLVALASRIVLARAVEPVGHYARPLGRIALGAAVSLVAIAAAPSVGALLLWIGVLAAAATLGSWNSVAMLATMATTGPDQAGRASGWVITGFLGGLGVVPPLFGALVDRYDAYAQGWLGLAAAALLAAAATRLWARHDGRAARDVALS